MVKPEKSKADLFASMEDDLKQFWSTLSGALREVSGAIARRVGLTSPAVNHRAHPKRLSGDQSAEMVHSDPFPNFRFRLKIDGIQLAEFREITIGETTIGPSEPYDESLVRKLKGLRKFSTITLKRGFSTDQKLFDWYKSIADGKIAAAFKRVVIALTDETSGKEKRVLATQAWPSKYRPSDINAKSNEVYIETLELTNEGIEH